MCTGLEIALITGVAGGLAAKQGEDQRKAAKQANATAVAATQAQATAADQAMNKANAKTPNVQALDNANAQGGGAGTTMLTGPMGIDPSTLTLGKQTLLGA